MGCCVEAKHKYSSLYICSFPLSKDVIYFLCVFSLYNWRKGECILPEQSVSVQLALSYRNHDKLPR